MGGHAPSGSPLEPPLIRSPMHQSADTLSATMQKDGGDNTLSFPLGGATTNAVLATQASEPSWPQFKKELTNKAVLDYTIKT